MQCAIETKDPERTVCVCPDAFICCHRHRNESLWHYVFLPVSCLFLYSSFYANNLRGMSTLAEVNEFQRDPGGALSSFRYPIKLSGHTKFLRNIGGGLSVINTEIDVEQNAQVLFQENEAIFGGGVQMEERCRVSLCCAFAVCYLPILHICAPYTSWLHDIHKCLYILYQWSNTTEVYYECIV